MKMSRAAQADLARLIRNRNFDRTEKGVFVPAAGILFGGFFSHAVNGEDWQHDHNIVVNEGLDYFLDVALSDGTQLAASTWHVGIYEANYTPLATDDASNISANSTESTAYDESERQDWTDAGASSQSITNSASTADFTMNASKTIYGAFLIGGTGAQSPGGSTGTLVAASKFAASRAVVATDVLSVTYTLTAADA
jgi:hypothetical protein